MLTDNYQETEKIGKDLAKRILKLPKGNNAFIIGIEGNLGAGKTVFVQGFAKGLGIKEKVLSPTFTLIKKFKIQNSKFKNLYHIDCYRIESPKEILDLNYEEIVSDPQNIVVIEWAGKIKNILPKDALWIDLKLLGKQKRQIIIKSWT